MYPRNLQVEHRTDARTALAMVAFLMVGLSGCASQLAPRPNRPPADDAPYVGVFTGSSSTGSPCIASRLSRLSGRGAASGRAPEPDESAGHDN